MMLGANKSCKNLRSCLAVFFFAPFLSGLVWAEDSEVLLEKAAALLEVQKLDSVLLVGGQALEAAQISTTVDDTILASIHYTLGVARVYRSELTEAETHLLSALDIREQSLGSNHPQVADCAYYLGATYMRAGEFDQAGQFYARALAIRETAFGDDHQIVAATLVGYSSLLFYTGQLREAEALTVRLLTILESQPNPDPAQRAKAHMLLAAAKIERGYFQEAGNHYRTAFQLADNSNPPDSLLAASILSGMGKTALLLGDYPAAEDFLLRAIETDRVLLGKSNFEVGALRLDLGRLYGLQARFDAAEGELNEALDCLRAALGDQHPYVAYGLQILSQVYLDVGMYGEARSYQEQALQITQASYGLEHPESIQALNALADICLAEGDYAIADSLYRVSLEAITESRGADHPFLLESLNGLGYLYTDLRKFDSATTFFAKALSLGQNSLGENHPVVASTREYFGRLLRRQGATEESLRMLHKAVLARCKNLEIGCVVLSEQSALDYAYLMRRSVGDYLAAYVDGGMPGQQFRREAAGIILQTKGAISDEIFQRSVASRVRTAKTSYALQDSLNEAKFELASSFADYATYGETGAYRQRLDSLTIAIEMMETSMTRESASFRSRPMKIAVTVSEIEKALPPGAVLVEYLRYNYDARPEGSVTPRYMALVLSAHSDLVIIDLGEAEPIDDLVENYRFHLKEISNSGRIPDEADLLAYRKIGTELSQAMWRPVVSQMAEEALIFIAADGALNLVSFGGLPVGESGYVIEEYAIHYLTAGRDLLRSLGQSPVGAKLVAFGDPDFRTTTASQSSSGDQVAEDGSSQIGKVGNCGSWTPEDLAPLPGTGAEIKIIVRLWQTAQKGTASIFLGAEATEANLRIHAVGSKVLHIATHGYHAPDSCFQSAEGESAIFNRGFASRNPLLLSGIFLASVGNHKRGSRAGLDDGVLTAEEISTLDLSATSWVVLSACESGLGSIRSGEGVYGLRRAFQMAGARTIISSLWKVSDNMTSRIMGRLYRRSDELLPLALREVYLKILEDLRRRGQPDHPYNWAAFIAIGEWSGLH